MSKNRVLDWIITALAIVVFPIVMEISIYFSPSGLNHIFGISVDFIYGIACASMLVGLGLVLHLDPRLRNHLPSKIMKYFSLCVSVLYVVFFVLLRSDALSFPMIFGDFMSYFVPLVPLIFVVMIFALGYLSEIKNKKVSL